MALAAILILPLLVVCAVQLNYKIVVLMGVNNEVWYIELLVCVKWHLKAEVYPYLLQYFIQYLLGFGEVRRKK